MRKLASIQTIEEIQPIDGADMIEKARVLGWWVVIKKGQFNVGDKIIYHEIDCLLPIKPVYEFLLNGTTPKNVSIDGKEFTGIRLRTKKLRGCISQGLILPMIDDLNLMDVGDDVSEALGIVKYEQPIPACLSGLVRGKFPEFLPKTDEPRIQNCSHLLETDDNFYITEKLDGTSATFYKRDGVFGVCSRNIDLFESDGNTHWNIARQLDLENKLEENMCIQGEIIGESIQGNKYKQKGQRLFVYNIYNIQQQRYLGFNELIEYTTKKRLETVPIISRDYNLKTSLEDILKMAENKSVLSEVEREGIVVRPMIEKTAAIEGIIQRFSFKAISNKFLLKYED